MQGNVEEYKLIDMKDTKLKGGFDAFDGDETNVVEKKAKPKKKSFTVRGDEGTKTLLDNLQWLKQYVVTKKPISQADVVQEALELLAKEMDYEKLKKKYSADLEHAVISSGRKRKS